MPHPPRLFTGLALATAFVTFALVILGATVRVTGSGMGCPDWPLCYGQILPPWNLAAILEWLHRLVAAGVSGFTLLLLAWIAASRALRQRFGLLALLLLACLGSQIALGAYTVAVSNGPLSVALHLLMGYLFLGVLLSISRRALLPAEVAAAPAVPGSVRAGAALVTVAVLGQAFLGGLVAASYAGRACPDFPTCHGEWLPPLVGNVGLQMGHRFGALTLTAAVLAFVWLAESHAPARFRAWSRGVGMLLGVQLAIGLAAVLLPVSLVINVLHQVGAVSLFSFSWLALHAALSARGSAYSSLSSSTVPVSRS